MPGPYGEPSARTLVEVEMALGAGVYEMNGNKHEQCLRLTVNTENAKSVAENLRRLAETLEGYQAAPPAVRKETPLHCWVEKHPRSDLKDEDHGHVYRVYITREDGRADWTYQYGTLKEAKAETKRLGACGYIEARPLNLGKGEANE